MLKTATKLIVYFEQQEIQHPDEQGMRNFPNVFSGYNNSFHV